MSLGTPTINNAIVKNQDQAVFVDDVSVALDNSYPTGGYTGLEAALQAAGKTGRTIVRVSNASAGTAGGYVANWDIANKKLMLFGSNGASPNALLEIPNATDLHLVTLRLIVESV